MRLISVTLLLLWASLVQGADPATPTGTAANAVPTPPVAPVAASAPATASAVAPAPAAGEKPASGTEQDEEKVLAKALAARNLAGRTVELPVGGRTVLAFYTPQTAARARGAVVLLHDLGGHADWPGAVASLRRGLPASGWSTLSVQLPLPGKGTPDAQRAALLDQAPSRIEAALAFLKSEGQFNVVLAGHGIGAAAALDYAVAHGEAVRGVVLLGLPLLRGADPRLATGEVLGRLKVPAFDVYGGADTGEVTATAALRRQGAGHGGDYLQLEVPGANHFFDGQGATLAARVRGWLDRHAGGAELPTRAISEEPTTPTNTNKGTQP